MKIKDKLKNIKGILYLAVLFYVVPILGHAAENSDGPGSDSGEFKNPLKAGDLLSLINLLVDGLMKVGLVAAACFIIYSGFLFITAQGKPEQIDKAKTNFYWTIIGTAILLGAKAIVSIITGTLKSL